MFQHVVTVWNNKHRTRNDDRFGGVQDNNAMQWNKESVIEENNYYFFAPLHYSSTQNVIV
jgi:hypothetical protein